MLRRTFLSVLASVAAIKPAPSRPQPPADGFNRWLGLSIPDPDQVVQGTEYASGFYCRGNLVRVIEPTSGPRP